MTANTVAFNLQQMKIERFFFPEAESSSCFIFNDCFLHFFEDIWNYVWYQIRYYTLIEWFPSRYEAENAICDLFFINFLLVASSRRHFYENGSWQIIV